MVQEKVDIFGGQGFCVEEVFGTKPSVKGGPRKVVLNVVREQQFNKRDIVH